MKVVMGTLYGDLVVILTCISHYCCYETTDCEKT